MIEPTRQIPIAAVALAAAFLVAAPAQSQKKGFCTATTTAQFKACEYQLLDDFYVAQAKCINVSNGNERNACFADADEERSDAVASCGAERAQRLQICGELGEARFDPSFDLADFDSDYHHLTRPNPYLPLTIGYRWDYTGTLETNTITALDETKLIEGVTCIVLKDLRYEDGQLAEETDDWYGQRKDGTVDFCGEQVNNFETFPGDDPVRPERISTEGQWKAGRDGDPPGTFLLGSPKVGDVHRQEFSPGSAEDTVHYLSTSYGYGSDPTLDQHVPQALVELLCPQHDCWVTSETSGLEPGELTRQYYARGIGFFLGIDANTGQSVQLFDCNFDARCASLPEP